MDAKTLLLILTCALATPATTSAAPPPATGRLQLTFTERSPLSAPDVVMRRQDWDDRSTAGLDTLAYDLANESFDVIVPATYKPGVPHGLLVWMGVTDFSPAWLPVLARHKLIYVSANNAQGRLAMYALPLDAVHNVKKSYAIDESRVYVCGFSRGGQAAAFMLRAFPDVFRGGLFLLGGWFYHSHKFADGHREPTVLPDQSPMWKGPLDRIKADAKIVLIKGQRDPQWTAQEGRCDHESLVLDGFTRVTYLEVPNLGHTHPNPAWFEKGIAALEAKPKPPPTTRPTTQPNPLPTQSAQAQRLLSTALFQLDEKNWTTQWVKDHPELAARIRNARQNSARQYLQQLLTDYPTTPATTKARPLLTQLGFPNTSPTTKP